MLQKRMVKIVQLNNPKYKIKNVPIKCLNPDCCSTSFSRLDFVFAEDVPKYLIPFKCDNCEVQVNYIKNIKAWSIQFIHYKKEQIILYDDQTINLMRNWIEKYYKSKNDFLPLTARNIKLLMKKIVFTKFE